MKLHCKLCHGNLPGYVTNLFTCNAPGTINKYDLRPSGICKTHTVHNCIAGRCIRFMLPKIINETDPSVTEKIDAHSFQGFTVHLKVTKIHFMLLIVWLLVVINTKTHNTHIYRMRMLANIIHKDFLCCYDDHGGVAFLFLILSCLSWYALHVCGICSHNEYRTLNMYFSANEWCTSFANFISYFYM